MINMNECLSSAEQLHDLWPFHTYIQEKEVHLYENGGDLGFSKTNVQGMVPFMRVDTPYCLGKVIWILNKK